MPWYNDYMKLNTNIAICTISAIATQISVPMCPRNVHAAQMSTDVCKCLQMPKRGLHAVKTGKIFAISGCKCQEMSANVQPPKSVVLLRYYHLPAITPSICRFERYIVYFTSSNQLKCPRNAHAFLTPWTRATTTKFAVVIRII